MQWSSAWTCFDIGSTCTEGMPPGPCDGRSAWLYFALGVQRFCWYSWLTECEFLPNKTEIQTLVNYVCSEMVARTGVSDTPCIGFYSNLHGKLDAKGRTGRRMYTTRRPARERGPRLNGDEIAVRLQIKIGIKTQEEYECDLRSNSSSIWGLGVYL
jgi:hypothetical protein